MRLVLCAGLALATCTGCEGDDDDGSDGRVAGAGGDDDGSAGMPRSSGGRAAAGLIDSFCDTIEGCCRAAWAQIGRAACEASFDDVPLFTALRAGTAAVVEPAFGTCLAAMRRNVETCGRAPADMSSCTRAFIGTRAEGESCAEAIECVRDERLTLCVKTGDPAGPEPQLGVCHTLTRAARGEPCQFSTQTTLPANDVTTTDPAALLGYCSHEDGLRCDASRSCVPLLGEGEACSLHHECGRGLYCGRTCRRTLPSGSACTDTIECEQGLLCSSGRCAAPSFEGGSCTAMAALPPVL